MHRSTFPIIAIFSGILFFISCQSSPKKSQETASLPTERPIQANYRGNISSTQYDSIVNQLTLYKNETFDIRQVDRIAEHHLNEREHHGIYAYLADSTQLALYSDDGILMLRFHLSERSIIQMTLTGDRLLDSSNLWKLQMSNHH